MSAVDSIRSQIEGLYRTDPHIHVNVSLTHPKLCLIDVPAVLCGVYPHIFRIEEHSDGMTRCHTLQYNDVVTHRIEILELKQS